MVKNLDAVMKPKSIAVIGASERQEAFGCSIFKNLLEYGFAGDLYPINNKSETIFNVKAYKSILDVPGPVDMAVIVIPNKFVPQVIEECGQKGVKGLVIITAGYKETGKDGAQLERELAEQINKLGMTAIGPNCLGILNTEPSVHMDASFAEEMPLAGKTAFVSQSGALGAAILNISKDMNVGLSQFVSMGNKAVVNEATLVEYWGEEENVNQILLYVESIEDPQTFRELASKISKKKPVIAVKAGRSSAGAKAASSHTGALAGADLAADALLKQCGVIRANSVLELFQYAQIFNNCDLPKGNRVGIVTNTGGPGIMATDALSEYGLVIADYSEETRRRCREFLPSAASVGNPIDMIASAPIEHYQKTLEVVMNDPNVDIIMVIYVPFLGVEPMDCAKAIMEIKAQHPEKPIVSVFMTKLDFFSQISKVDINVPFYQYPEDAAKAISKLDAQRQWAAKPLGTEPVYNVNKDIAKQLFIQALYEGRDQLTTLESIDVLTAYGIRTCKYDFADNLEDAVKAANEIGYPVVMKITSTKISHKTEIGGVIVNIKSEAELRDAYNGLIERLRSKSLEDSLDGVIIQEMVKGDREMVCGIATDPQYGHLMMFGLGGIYVETIKDIIFRVGPINSNDADEMVKSVKAYKILMGSRGELPANIEQIEETLLRLSQLIKDFPFIEELDINPLKVSDKSGEGVAVDGRIKIKAEYAIKELSSCGSCCSSCSSCSSCG